MEKETFGMMTVAEVQDLDAKLSVLCTGCEPKSWLELMNLCENEGISFEEFMSLLQRAQLMAYAAGLPQEFDDGWRGIPEWLTPKS